MEDIYASMSGLSLLSHIPRLVDEYVEVKPKKEKSIKASFQVVDWLGNRLEPSDWTAAYKAADSNLFNDSKVKIKGNALELSLKSLTKTGTYDVQFTVPKSDNHPELMLKTTFKLVDKIDASEISYEMSKSKNLDAKALT